MRAPLHTAILLFLRNEQEEARAKALRAHFGSRRSLRMVRALNHHAIRVSRQSGLPVIIIKGEQQIGNNFGERFANAFEEAFMAGYENVIAIGNDCLSLSAEHLHKAAALLNSGEGLVLGPAEDGGAYIVGVHRGAYQRAAFINLPWQTPEVLEALIGYARQQRAVCSYLPMAQDMDDAPAFRKVVSQMPTHLRVVQILRNILKKSALQPADAPFPARRDTHSTRSLRAPPLSVR